MSATSSAISSRNHPGDNTSTAPPRESNDAAAAHAHDDLAASGQGLQSVLLGALVGVLIRIQREFKPVSYTHLDVYKRQHAGVGRVDELHAGEHAGRHHGTAGQTCHAGQAAADEAGRCV